MRHWVFLWLVGGLAACSGPQASLNLKELALQVGQGGRVELRYSGKSEVCPSGQACTYRLGPDQTVELRAWPEGNFFFAGWAGDCSGYGGCTLQMAQDRRVEARFEARVGEFSMGQVPDPVVVPAGTTVELAVGLRPTGGFNAPPAAWSVVLSGALVGGAVDQVAYRYLPERSGPERLVLELKGPEVRQVWSYLAAPARLSVRVGTLERTLDFTLAAAPCLAGCGR